MKVLLASLKDKKSSHDVNEGTSAFQTITTELYKEPKKKKKRAPEISNKLY